MAVMSLRKSPAGDTDYYFVTVRPLRDSLVSCGVYSQFVAFSVRNEHWEIRRASTIHYEWLRVVLQKLGGSAPELVHDEWGLARLMQRGGNCTIVTSEIMGMHLSRLLQPTECVRDIDCFVPTFDPPTDTLPRTVPTRRQRANVLRRDGRRCTICGRSPLHHVDLELDVHHVLPVRRHGPTVEENLLTLCGTCHAGLNPDHDPALRQHGRLAGPLGEPGLPIRLMGVTDNLVDGLIVDRQTIMRKAA